MLPVSHAGKKLDSEVVRPRVGGVVPLRFEVVFSPDIPLVEVLFSEVSISDVLAFLEGVVDVPIVVVTYVIAAIDTAVAKVVDEARVFWWLACRRSSSGGGGSRARLFVVILWQVWRVSLACVLRPTRTLRDRYTSLTLWTR